MPLVNHAFPRATPAIFVIFTGSEQQSPLLLLVRTQIRPLRRFGQNPLFLARDKGTVYQKHRSVGPRAVVLHRQERPNWRLHLPLGPGDLEDA